MIDILKSSSEILENLDFSTIQIHSGGRHTLLFEDPTVIGFLLDYSSSEDLIANWKLDFDHLITEYQFALRRANKKAWNLYAVLLAHDAPVSSHPAELADIEEDLAGARKIARSGITSYEDLHGALLSLLPIRDAPRLEAVDMTDEIKLRVSEIHPRIVDAFLKAGDEATIIQVIEEEA